MCGLPPIRIQPAEDLRAAVKDGIYINLDNYFEVAEVDRILLGATSGRWQCHVKNRYLSRTVFILRLRVTEKPSTCEYCASTK